MSDRVEGDKVGGDKAGGDLVRGDKYVISQDSIDKLAVGGRFNNLPRSTDTYIDERGLVDEVIAAIDAGDVASVVGIGGMGGIGKTEAAIVAAWKLFDDDRFHDGVAMIDLQGYAEGGTPALSAESALRQLLQLFGVSVGARPGNMPETDFDALLSQKWREVSNGRDALIILDNARDSAVLKKLLPAKSGPHVLITSRDPVRIKGAKSVTVPRMEEEGAQLALRICERLTEPEAARLAKNADGLPLVIEIIASLIDEMDDEPASVWIDRLESAGGGADALAKARARLALSIDALEAEEAARFAALSLFAGGFHAGSAQRVWAMGEEPARTFLARLRRRNLILPAQSPFAGDDLGPRWRIHDLLRAAGAARFGALDAARALAFRQAWAEEALSLLGAANAMYKSGHDGVGAGLALYEQEAATISAAREWAATAAERDDRAARVAMDLPNHEVLDLRLAPRERLRWLEAGLPAARRLGDKTGEAVLLGNAGHRLFTLGDLERAEEMYRKSLTLEEEMGRKEGMASDYGNLGNLLRDRGDLDGAEEMYRKGLALDEEMGRKEGMARKYGNLGILLHTRGDLDGAEEMYRKGLALDEEMGRKEGMASNYGNLGILLRDRGDLDGAEEMYRKSLALNEEMGRKEGMANQYGNLGQLLIERGDRAGGVALIRQARDLFAEMGMAPQLAQVEGWLRDLGEAP